MWIPLVLLMLSFGLGTAVGFWVGGVNDEATSTSSACTEAARLARQAVASPHDIERLRPRVLAAVEDCLGRD